MVVRKKRRKNNWGGRERKKKDSSTSITHLICYIGDGSDRTPHGYIFMYQQVNFKSSNTIERRRRWKMLFGCFFFSSPVFTGQLTTTNSLARKLYLYKCISPWKDIPLSYTRIYTYIYFFSSIGGPSGPGCNTALIERCGSNLFTAFFHRQRATLS